MDFQREYDLLKGQVEKALAKCFGQESHGVPFDGLLDAMEYSLMAGGKRLRPVLTLALCRACGGDIEAALPVACAVEMLHTYSLIHDDLPCMDNDDLRRGQPTCHKVYGECSAVLAGDGLQAEAFGTILRCGLPVERRVSCAQALADAAGIDGICGGQFMDMTGGDAAISEEVLTEMQSRKTGSLLIAACRMGIISAGGSKKLEEAAVQYGACLGAAFQIRDDMLDEFSTVEELGKPIGSDAGNGKTTFLTLYGREKCGQMVDRLTKAAKEAVAELPDPEFLQALADAMAVRNH